MGRLPARLPLDDTDGESGMGRRLAAYPGGPDEGGQGFRLGWRGGEGQLDEERGKRELTVARVERRVRRYCISLSTERRLLCSEGQWGPCHLTK